MPESQAAPKPRKPSLTSRIARRIILWIWGLKGWTVDGDVPRDIKKFVIAGAPHSSNWDIVFFVGATAEKGIEPNIMAKHTLFNWPIGRFMYDMGGIPIDRRKRANYVEQMAQAFEERDQLPLVIAVEGTRGTDGSWKSGFYHIAQAANVPIVPAWVCNERKILGFGPPIYPTGNYGEDLLKIAQFMRSKLPNYDRFKVLEAQAQAIIEGKDDD
ncbi:MAG: 1-acyl-sn-glycerol-3-phosphate acyltransferase [Erythrobacter sp.]